MMPSIHLVGRDQALEVLGHAGGVVGRGAPQALDHVNAVPALTAAGTVVLGAPKVHTLLGHLSQLQLLDTAAGHTSLDFSTWPAFLHFILQNMSRNHIFITQNCKQNAKLILFHHKPIPKRPRNCGGPAPDILHIFAELATPIWVVHVQRGSHAQPKILM